LKQEKIQLFEMLLNSRSDEANIEDIEEEEEQENDNGEHQRFEEINEPLEKEAVLKYVYLSIVRDLNSKYW
jgi:hypothetical protein